MRQGQAANASPDFIVSAARRQSDFLRILTEPDHNMLRQQQALLGTEGVALEFAPDAVEEIASLAEQVGDVRVVYSRPGVTLAPLLPADRMLPCYLDSLQTARDLGEPARTVRCADQSERGQHRRPAAPHSAGADPGGGQLRRAGGGALLPCRVALRWNRPRASICPSGPCSCFKSRAMHVRRWLDVCACRHLSTVSQLLVSLSFQSRSLSCIACYGATSSSVLHCCRRC